MYQFEPARMSATERRREIVAIMATALCRLPISPGICSEKANTPCFPRHSSAQCHPLVNEPANGGQAA
jgi:hypothetical protein